jgi:hypothetical protein
LVLTATDHQTSIIAVKNLIDIGCKKGMEEENKAKK